MAWSSHSCDGCKEYFRRDICNQRVESYKILFGSHYHKQIQVWLVLLL